MCLQAVRFHKMISSIIFDLDGTLIDSVIDVRAALNQLLSENGRHPLTDADVRTMVGEGVKPMLTNAFARTGEALSPDQVDDLVARYLELYINANHDTKIIYPGVIKLLDTFMSHNISMGVCTNKPKISTHIVLKNLGLAQYFKAVVCPEDTPFRKPDPRHAEQALRSIGGARESSLFVGDSESDLRSAQSAEIPCVLVSYGYAQSSVSQLSADFVIGTFAELLPIVMGS